MERCFDVRFDLSGGSDNTHDTLKKKTLTILWQQLG